MSLMARDGASARVTCAWHGGGEGACACLDGEAVGGTLGRRGLGACGEMRCRDAPRDSRTSEAESARGGAGILGAVAPMICGSRESSVAPPESVVVVCRRSVLVWGDD